MVEWQIQLGDQRPADAIKFLSENKYDALITFEGEPTADDDDPEVDRKHENCRKSKEACVAHGLEHISFDIEDFKPNLQVYMQVKEKVKELIGDGKKVCISCGEGFGRTGTILAMLKLDYDLQSDSCTSSDSDDEVKINRVGQEYKAGSSRCPSPVEYAVSHIRGERDDDKSVETAEDVSILTMAFWALLEKNLKKILNASTTPDHG